MSLCLKQDKSTGISSYGLYRGNLRWIPQITKFHSSYLFQTKNFSIDAKLQKGSRSPSIPYTPYTFHHGKLLKNHIIPTPKPLGKKTLWVTHDIVLWRLSQNTELQVRTDRKDLCKFGKISFDGMFFFGWIDWLIGLKKSNAPKEPFVCPDRFRDFPTLQSYDLGTGFRPSILRFFGRGQASVPKVPGFWAFIFLHPKNCWSQRSINFCSSPKLSVANS